MFSDTSTTLRHGVDTWKVKYCCLIMLWQVAVLLSCIKLLFLPAYRSTDFEVHRNWLAITHSLPIEKWYVDATSEWTLDYPPLFAWFEFLLSQVAVYFDPKMLEVTNTNYASEKTILFQRLSVIITDLVLVYGTHECSKYIKSHRFRKCSKWRSKWKSPSTVLQLIILGNVGLFLVDHIHFQYNGILFGILLISVANILQGNHIVGAFWFAILLNMKHIFLYMAPVYVVYLLRNYCFTSSYDRHSLTSFSLVRLTKLGIVVSAIFCVSFGPFISMEQLPQVLSRLFPFKRGLCHSYWAPNFWALYNAVDKVSAAIGKNVGFHVNSTNGSMTNGMVQEFQHSVLPSITPQYTFILTLLSAMPCLWKLWKSPGNPLHFVRSLVICSSCAFMFGWHVHEKAILMVIIPFSLTAVLWRKEAEIFTFLSTVGHYSLFPLIFTSGEEPVKLLIFMIFSNYTLISFSELFGIRYNLYLCPILSLFELLYLMGFVPLFVYHTFLHKLLNFDKSYPFLPLLMTSVYCAGGIVYSFMRYYYLFLKMDSTRKQKTF